MRKPKFNIIIIEPSNIIIRGLSTILNESERFCVIDTFCDVKKFQEQNTLRQMPDIVIVNPTLVAYSKKGILRSLFPEACLVALLYNYMNRETLVQFNESIEVYDKPSRILHKLERSAKSDESVKSGPDAGDLSGREKEILVAVVKGMLNKEIADLYNISIHTVMAHRKNISRKTGIKSVSGFVVYALLHNYIDEYEIQ